MGNSAILTVKILTDASQAGKGADAAASRFGKMGGTIRKAAVPAAGLGLALLAGAKKAVDAASRTQQAFGGLDAVFGSTAGTMKKFAGGAADSVGLAKSEYGELATLIGSQLKNAGVPMDQLAGKTNDLIGTGGDLAAMYGGTTADAVAALSSALKGEFDPMEKYGASLSANAIKAQMVADGTDKLTGKQAAQAKTAATLALVTQQTADAHGAAAKEYDSAASAQQRLSAKTENLMSDLGTVLLPVVSMLADKFAALAAFTTKHTTATQILVGVVAGLVVGILALNAAMSAFNTISLAVAGVQKVMKGSILATRIQLIALGVQQKLVAAWSWLMATGFRAAWLAATGPVGLVIIAVIAIVAVFILLYKKVKVFRDFVNATWALVKAGAAIAANVVKRVWQIAWAAVSAYVRIYATVIRAVFNAVRSAASSVAGVVRSVFRAAWSAISSAARSGMAGVRSAITAVRTIASSVASFVREKLGGIWSDIAAAARRGLSGLASLFSPITGAINGVIGAVQNLIGWLGRIHVPKISIPHIGGKSVPAPASTSSTTFRAASMRGGATATVAGPAPIVINVSGAVDPENVARQIKRILQGHDRRIGLRAS